MAVIVITLRASPGVDPTRALRRLLKFAARSCGLTCVGVTADDPLVLDAPGEQDVAYVASHAPKSSNGE
jgi:hypothetical protein